MMEKSKNVPKIRFKGFSGEWVEKKFCDNIISIKTGTNLLGNLTNKGMPLLKMGNIQRGFFSLKRVELLDENVNIENAHIVYYGDFLFNTRNTLELVGKGATWMGESNVYAFNSNIARFVFRGIDTIFFNYLYNTKEIISQVQARAMGTTSVAAIYPENLNSVKYRLPTIDEQTLIGNYFQNIDKLIEAKQSRINKLKNIKKACLEKMFPKKGKNAPEIRFKGFSGEWEEKKIDKLLEERNIQAPKNDTYPLMAFIAYEGVAPKGDRYNREFLVNDELNKKYKRTEYGDFIYSSNNLETGSIGLNNYGSASISPVYSIFMPTDLANSDFIGRLLIRKEFINIMVKWRQGVIYGQWRIHESDFIKIDVCVPSVPEQEKIGNFFKKLDNLIAKNEYQLTKLKNIKKACLEKMFVNKEDTV